MGMYNPGVVLSQTNRASRKGGKTSSLIEENSMRERVRGERIGSPEHSDAFGSKSVIDFRTPLFDKTLNVLFKNKLDPR